MINEKEIIKGALEELLESNLKNKVAFEVNEKTLQRYRIMEKDASVENTLGQVQKELKLVNQKIGVIREELKNYE